jgi:undecaprenyl-diphosphatase
MVMSNSRPFWMIAVRSKSFFGLVTTFFVITIVAAAGLTVTFDRFILNSFQSIHRSEFLDGLIITITTFGDISNLVIVAIVLTIIRRTRKTGMIFLISIVIIAILVMYIKPVIGRQMPQYSYKPILQLPKKFVIEEDTLVPNANSFSYPSNHIAVATSFAFIVSYQLIRKSKTAGILIWLFPFCLGITKLYILQHYFTDVIGGFIFGFIVSVVLSNLMKLDQPFLMSKFKGKDQDSKTLG